MGDAGVAGEINDETILAPDFTRKKIDQSLLQPAGTGVFVVELHDLLKTELAQHRGHSFGILNGPGNFRREQIVFDADDDTPRLVIESLGLSYLSLGGGGAERNGNEYRDEARSEVRR